MEYKNKIFSAIKSSGPLDLDEIQQHIGNVPKKQLAAELDQLIKKGWIKKDGLKYKVKMVLDRPLRYEPMEGTFRHIPKVPPEDASWTNPLADELALRDQAERGTCVGQSAAYSRDLDYMKLLDIKPSEQDKQQLQRDVTETDGLSCTLIHDVLYPDFSFSSDCAYHWSRKIGNVTYPSGSYVSAAVEAMRQLGCCLEKDWYSSKTSRCAPTTPYPWGRDTEVDARASLHKIDGYSKGNTWEGAKEAIRTHGHILMPINIYENYQTEGCVGMFPEPSGPVVGSHALCWIGYTDTHLICVHSWGNNWSKIGGISKGYFDLGAGPYFVVLDDTEVKDMYAKYTKVRISANTHCVFTVGNDYFPGTEVSLMLPIGEHYDIRAVPTETGWEPPEITTSFTVTENSNVSFTFQKETTFLHRLILWILSWFK